ncbi:2-oxo-4-hydroxy-4-carboxy-5-ureidoimidazoline decarboxylase [Alteromonas aestuariivivens]|uniref:2-oxo-4-hydroxy-4-carboxy-5-ureidoimidazoline decarboxylase n=1 Tax=Alteromonas aestuariivivens TaxID=1938339 RepID=A0A3D8MB68_9ALTE|nr:2-oxo-4-hydroxy-4-carboxy-5-ureidoimidazoline decarboxylase [Alteromonas aestuariivivens]RDV27540.1 2-oxo-4-hydroxy-4-carboxy-5-ureidoimidazoline decarboxylase [Alteromonas aestuariivivens]
MTLEQLNQLHKAKASEWFAATCAAKKWVDIMVAHRPYSSIEAVRQQALEAWKTMQQEDLLEAFSAHPMIGDMNSLREKYAHTKTMAAGEQSGAAQAGEATLEALRDGNLAYLDKHGFIFIICATGLSAETMLEALNARLPNDTPTEIRNAAEQQIKITLLRIEKNLSQEVTP